MATINPRNNQMVLAGVVLGLAIGAVVGQQDAPTIAERLDIVDTSQQFETVGSMVTLAGIYGAIGYLLSEVM